MDAATQEQELVEAAVTDDTGAAPSFEQRVNQVVSKMVQDDKGNWQLPEGDYSEEVKYAANAERRRRSTESALGKTRTQLKAIETLTEELKKKVADKVQVELSPQDKTRLDELRYDNPDEWRKQMNKLEQDAYASLTSELDEVASKATQLAEVDARKQVLADFNARHSDIQITDEVVENDIPPRITKKLAEGKISFEEFLNTAYDYLTKPKKIKKDEGDAMINLGKADGTDTPSASARNKTDSDSYAKTIF